ncbi:Triheme c-type cytochrome DsrJ [Magnetospira sp. QH-2]|nr:Triheme c-type cytochrome DsrJ [Magnetospira sp. QH-2]
MVVAVLALGFAPAQAGDGVPMPQIIKGKGAQCVEPTNVMRRNHMDYLKHQRDETMREGIRGNKYSLTECVECHATPDPRPQIKAETLYGFCKQCHAYAAVTIDCFGCHTPVKGESGHSELKDGAWKGFELAHKRMGEETAR